MRDDRCSSAYNSNNNHSISGKIVNVLTLDATHFETYAKAVGPTWSRTRLKNVRLEKWRGNRKNMDRYMCDFME